MEELVKHGTLLPPEMQGLTDEQIEELKLKDKWGDECIPSGGFTFEKDPIGMYLKKIINLVFDYFN